MENADLQQIKVVLVEDDLGVREKLVENIRKLPALRLQGAFSNTEEALGQIERLSPEVLVTDIRLPGLNGIACTVAVKRVLPKCQILVLTAFMDTRLVMNALKAGASGYLIKTTCAENLPQAILDVWGGGAPMSPVIARKLVESFHGKLSAEHETIETLTEREEEILNLLSKGYPTKEIGPKVGISYATVRFHIRNIFEKLHVNNQAQAILKYLG